MSVEQVVRDFLSNYELSGIESSIGYLADKMTLTVVMPPLQGGRKEFVGLGTLIKEALPDFRWGVQSMNTQGNQTTVIMNWMATNTGVLHLGTMVPGAPDIPPTGRRVTVSDKFTFTVSDDKISALTVDSPSNGGLLSMFEQIGMPLPPM